MTDQGFRKFRRRRKRDDTPALEAVRNRPGAEDIGALSPEVAEPLYLPAEVEPGEALGFGVRETQVSDASAFDDIARWARPEQMLLPARLPDPWQIMRRVEVTGLGPRRSRLPLVDFFRSSASARAFDLLRTRMLHTLRDHGWKRVAVCAPTRGCGASFTAVNLALSLARVPHSRTVLMDLNLRAPGLAQALGVEQAALYHGDMRGFLRGEVRLEDHLVAASDTLALGLNGSACFNAAEVLHERRCAATLDEMMRRTHADVALFDLPPVLEHDDVTAFLPQVDGVLLVADGSQTTARHLKACEKMLAGQTPLLGVVLNRARDRDGIGMAR